MSASACPPSTGGLSRSTQHALLDIAPRDLPMIWDADFMLGPPAADGTDRYVLGEITVSSVFRYPTMHRPRSPAGFPTGCGQSTDRNAAARSVLEHNLVRPGNEIVASKETIG
jgi:hypothetical protein